MFKQALLGSALVAAPVLFAAAAAQTVPIVQPGVPGTAGRVLTPGDAARIADTRFTAADISFMQMMIIHHNQAVEMATLARPRTSRPEVLAVAGRINAAQKDEVTFMRDWLRERGAGVLPASMASHAAMGHSVMGHTMKGMATPQQMAALAAAKGTEFDRQFLTLMIAHHRGAVDMVSELLRQPGAAYDPVLYQFITDVSNEQSAEIKRMETLRAGLSNDPRVDLKAGYTNAGEAISNLTKIASLPRPAGFFDPANPSGLPPVKARSGAKPGDAPRPGNPKDDGAQFSDRGPLLNFAQTDMAFSGDRLFVGNYHGFNTYRLDANGVPTQVGSVVCPGGQGDVSVVGNLLLMSVEQGRGRVDCGLQGVTEDVSPMRFRGLRIFDISDIARPRQVGQVQTCRGSHTHSVVKGPEGDGKILVYNSGTAGVRKGEELAGCVGNVPGDVNTALFRIDIIEIPVANPAASRIIASPAVFADPRTGRLAGLWQGGDHGDGTQDTNVTDQCHDITVFPTKKLAAGACSGNGIIFDIADPRKPKRIDVVSDPGFAYWHSATFNNDGTKVLFTDEWGGGGRPRCRTFDPSNWGADAIYDIEGGKLTRRGTYKLPAPQSEQENCVAHNGSIIPVPGRDIMVQSWYQGGLSIFDFTDSRAPREIAFFDRGPVDAKAPTLAGYWSSYFYRGRIYATEIARGLDVFALQPSAMLSQNEIAAAALADQGGLFNPQQQYPVRWPAEPVVARAYMDQLRRGGALDAGLDQRLNAALTQASAQLGARARNDANARQLKALADEVKRGPADAPRRTKLATVLDEIADRLD
ncbi:DUF305 domain-containing protein [Sphingomonas sp. LY160]|uniref:DUF305 domain-containing protein n=1 Tax=Sphingomonas sp. LY160 TaxID=3095342 RepID=UPI002ADEE7EA|nr:DUF305 domain-containing protein [Sphingomonas sp. LY160]MEA1072294.1 DUF305 domain-containing protein [Sphingomonas sp. LY160]